MIRAVLGDTWRQSRQQVVFLVMLVVMLLALIAGIALPRPITNASGEKQFGTILSDRPDTFFASQWVNEYAKTLGAAEGAGAMAALRNSAGDRKLSPTERREQMQKFLQAQQQLRQEASAKAADIPEYRRAVEYYIHFFVGLMFRITMMLFIAACAGYFPGMLAAGAVDIVLSKPVSRLQIYLSRYVSGVVLYTAAIAVFCAIFYVGIGLRTGIYHARIFYCIPLLALSAMVLYSLLALIGTASRSATMAMVMGYVFYAVVDSLISNLLNIQPILEGLGWESVATAIGVFHHIMPNFSLMNDMALASLLNMPRFEFTPFAVALAWLFGSLGLGYWIFKRRDF